VGEMGRLNYTVEWDLRRCETARMQGYMRDIQHNYAKRYNPVSSIHNASSA
jgi:hypothetical protein